MLGAEVRLCAPKSLLPTHIESMGVSVSTDLMEVLNWCDAVNMLRVQNERMELSYFPITREYSQYFVLTGEGLFQLIHFYV